MSEDKQPKIVLLGDTKCSPEVLLHQILEDIDRAEGVIVMILEKEEPKAVDVRFSNMKLSDLVFAERVLGIYVTDALDESTIEPEEGENVV